MKIKFNRQYLLAGILVLAAAALLYIGGYYLFVTPVKANVSQLENQLGIQEALISGKRSLSGEKALSSSVQLQMKVPVEKATDQMLLQIKKIETDSETVIHSLSLIPVEEETAETDDIRKTMPQEINQINYFIEATAENYGQLTVFLEGLAAMDRLIGMELIQYHKEEEGRLNFTVSFTTYYVPALSILSEEMPEADFEIPAERTSPFGNEEQ